MATTTGSLCEDVKSPYSGPYVHYSCEYTSERADTASSAVSVTLRFKGWLNSSASHLGTGIILYIYARLSGGSWARVQLKSGSASWGDAKKHSAPAITLTGDPTAGKVTVEFYVARGDSGGNAGKLGTASSPKKYAAKLPAYNGSGGSSAVVRPWRYNVGGTYRKAQRYEKINGVWHEIYPSANASGTWKKGVN